MDGDTASKFVSSLVKSIQALCNGYIDFSSSIEVIGHIHLRIDQNQKFNYVLSEEVSKSKNEAATVFASHSYHSQPPPSITPGDGRSSSQTDSPSRHRRKSQQVPRVDESNSLTVSALLPDVPSVSKEKTLRQVSNSGDSPRSGTISDTDLARGVKKHENGSSVGKQVTSTQDSLDRRRKLQTESRPHDSAAKRNRPSGGSAANTGYEVIEIKEEPDDSSDYFGDDSAAGQDISQPDFSNLVAESLDRVGQMEGSSLLSGQHDQPFPVMLHANQSSSTTGLPGTSDQGAVASSSGGKSGSGIVGLAVPLSLTDIDLTKNPPSSLQQVSPLHGLHRIPVTGKKDNPQKYCRVCKQRGIRRDSRFHCPACPGQPGLCRLTDCFAIYHQTLLSKTSRLFYSLS